MKLKELKNWLETLPPEFDDFDLVNGDWGELEDEYYYRIDKPIIGFNVDENTKEIVFAHQTQDEIDKIEDEKE